MLYHEITIGILSLKTTRRSRLEVNFDADGPMLKQTWTLFSDGSDPEVQILAEALYRWNTSTISPARRELTVICGPAPPKEMWSDPNLSEDATTLKDWHWKTAI